MQADRFCIPGYVLEFRFQGKSSTQNNITKMLMRKLVLISGFPGSPATEAGTTDAGAKWQPLPDPHITGEG